MPNSMMVPQMTTGGTLQPTVSSSLRWTSHREEGAKLTRSEWQSSSYQTRPLSPHSMIHAQYLTQKGA